jgi:hypothetical protein
MCTLKGDFVTDVYGWVCGGGALIYRTLLDPLLQPFPISSPFLLQGFKHLGGQEREKPLQGSE